MLCLGFYGASFPQPLMPSLIVSGEETLVASAIATEPPFNADGTGKLDATEAIQAALNAVGSAGGGVVYLPPGRYLLGGTLKLPYATTLAGAAEPLARNDIASGTLLLVTSAGGDEQAPPLLDLMAVECGLMHLAIYYPLQRPDAPVPYPFTISGQMMRVRDIILCNSYNGVEVKAVNCSVIARVRGTALRRGLVAPHSGEFSWMHEVQFSPDFWADTADQLGDPNWRAGDAELISDYCKANLVGFEFGRIDGIALYRCGAETSKTGFLVQKRPEENPHPVFGLGGAVAGLIGSREEVGWDPWYYGLHYADLDLVPEAKDRSYEFAATPKAARTSDEAFFLVTKPPYGAVGNGQVDDTEALEKALAEAGDAGGGIVYLPQGEYKITRPLTVPEGVELRGPLGVNKAREYRQTCALACYVDAGAAEAETAPAFITLEAHSGLRGLSVIYPEQSYEPEAFKAYPYTVRGAGEGVWVVDVLLVNSWLGIDFSTYRCDSHLVRDVWATALRKGLAVGGGSRDGQLERVTFSYGPWAEAGRFAANKTESTTSALSAWSAAETLFYEFGDCQNETTWGLAGFLPKVQYHFVDQGAGGCRDAEFWLSLHDVAQRTSVQLDSGSDIDFLGYFVTGSYDRQRNWFELGKDFAGPVSFYAIAVHPPGVNHPFRCAPAQVSYYPEASLTTGRPVTASAGAPDSAVDRSLWTLWEAPLGATLQVDLGEEFLLNRCAIATGGFTQLTEQQQLEADLFVSLDGQDFRPVAHLATGEFFWVDQPVEPVRARYVELRITGCAVDGLAHIASFDVFGNLD